MRKIFRTNRAVSSLIGATFFVLILIIGLNLLFYILAQENSMATSLSTRERLTLDKKAEALQVLDVKIISTSNAINITALNSGGNTIHIVRIWVVNQSAPSWHQYFAVDYRIDVARILTGIGSSLGTFNPQSTFAFHLITERGNEILARYAFTAITPATAQGVGYLVMDWQTYNYTVSTSGGADQGPYPAWCITSVGGGQQRFQFVTKVINYWNRDVFLLSHSYVVFYQTSGSAQPFYIMASSSTAQNPIAYSTKVQVEANQLNPAAGGPPVILKFYAGAPSSVTQSQNALNGGSFAVFVVLFYQDVTGATLAQTIPFEASEVTSGGGC